MASNKNGIGSIISQAKQEAQENAGLGNTEATARRNRRLVSN